MKILIGQSYFRVLDPKELERNMPYPPLGTITAATLLKKLGHEIIFYDAMLSQSPIDFIDTIKKELPDLLLIYDDEFNYLTKMCLSNMREAAVSFIKEAKALSIPSIIYSSDATDFSSFYLNAGCSAIIYGEGEITLKETVEAFDNNNFDEIKKDIYGLKFLNNNEIYITSQRKIIDDLDTLPIPDYSFVDIESYRDIWIKNHGYFSLNISTTRGCPYNCNWCAKPLYGRTYHSKSPSTTVHQIQYLKDKYSIDHLWITDDIFGLKPLWLKEFANECKKLKTKVSYKCLSRPDLLLRENTINLLKETGCTTIWIGAESGSQKILDAMDKGTTVEQIFEAASKVKNAGIEIAFFIQFGYSGEVWDDILYTRNMIKKCLPDDIGVSVSYPLPGTKFYERVKNEFKGKTNWKDSDDLDMIFHGTYERNFYKLLHRLVHSEYRMFQIINKKEINKYLHLIYYSLKFIYYRIRINEYLNHEEPSYTLQNNLT